MIQICQKAVALPSDPPQNIFTFSPSESLRACLLAMKKCFPFPDMKEASFEKGSYASRGPCFQQRDGKKEASLS